MSDLIVSSSDFNAVVQKLRQFFLARGFLEAHTQNRLSIMAACEDPKTMRTFEYHGQKWPLPQTGQMWLEWELLKNPDVPGYFCVSTSYRAEPNPIPGRHLTIFPMFEFEMKGGMTDMIQMERELLEYLGYDSSKILEKDYDDVADHFGVKELETEHENRMDKELSPSVMLKNFPNHTDPFWNMKQHASGEHAYKVDVILSGQETIGSAERSCSPEEMRKMFDTISGGEYKQLLYNSFGEERVEEEFKEFLSHKFFPRSGGGIGVTRLIRSMKELGLLDTGSSSSSSRTSAPASSAAESSA